MSKNKNGPPIQVLLHIANGTANIATFAYLYGVDWKTAKAWLGKINKAKPISGYTYNPKEVKEIYALLGKPDMLDEIQKAA